MNARNVKLRIKLKSLAAESQMIKREESKLRNQGLATKAYEKEQQIRAEFWGLRSSLREHRVDVVRKESRATTWAYQYLRGIPYATFEASTNASVEDIAALTTKAHKMVCRYGPNKEVSLEDFEAWLEGTKEAPIVKAVEPAVLEEADVA